jgi:hypothetical protein
VNWAGPTQTNADELQMSAACIALNRFAQQYGNYPGSGIPPNRYEAENATLRHILLEATYGAFSGWGYVAGWNGNGQSIDFRVNCAVPGPRTLLFRYAGGAGNASRVVSINGVNAFPNRSFAGTGSWSAYATNSFMYNLPAGQSTISVVYNSALGSANYLNLDYLIVGDAAVPQITSISTSNSVVRLTWSAVTGQNYRVQFKDSLGAATWSDLGGTITASGPTASANDSLGSSMRFYRVVSP